MWNNSTETYLTISTYLLGGIFLILSSFSKILGVYFGFGVIVYIKVGAYTFFSMFCIGGVPIVIFTITHNYMINTSRPRQNDPHFTEDTFKCILSNENECILLSVSLSFVPKVRINTIPVLVQIMAWRRPGDKPLSEPMMVNLLTHIYASLGLNVLLMNITACVSSCTIKWAPLWKKTYKEFTQMPQFKCYEVC